jgi:hypothetical protein
MSGTFRRIVAVQRNRVECGRQALRGHAVREQVEALVGAKGVALSREHARGILVLALEREDARREREASGNVLEKLPAQDLAFVLEPRERDLAHLGPR